MISRLASKIVQQVMNWLGMTDSNLVSVFYRLRWTRPIKLLNAIQTDTCFSLFVFWDWLQKLFWHLDFMAPTWFFLVSHAVVFGSTKRTYLFIHMGGHSSSTLQGSSINCFWATSRRFLHSGKEGKSALVEAKAAFSWRRPGSKRFACTPNWIIRGALK